MSRLTNTDPEMKLIPASVSAPSARPCLAIPSSPTFALAATKETYQFDITDVLQSNLLMMKPVEAF